MLKNVAIPLMLAATEAEAQDKAARVKEAMRQDREKFFDGLIADVTPACDGTNTDIKALMTAVTTAKGLLDTAKAAEATLRAGAWKTANDDRKAAVDAAVTAELEGDLPALIDTLDEKLEDERAKANLWYAAKNALDEANTRVTVATDRLNAATTLKTSLETLDTAAKKAVTDTTAQIAKEKLWMGWLYCELGDKAGVGQDLDWWKYTSDKSGEST